MCVSFIEHYGHLEEAFNFSLFELYFHTFVPVDVQHRPDNLVD